MVPNFILPSDNYILTVQNERIGKNFAQQIYDHVSAASMKQFWGKKRRLTQNTFFSVDWNAIYKASSTSTKKTTRWINKHATGICGTNNNLLKWKQRDNDLCPRCGQPESAPHVWRCQGHGADKLWNQYFSDLEKWLVSNETAPALQHALIENLQHWLDNPEPAPSVRYFIETSQDMIGWDYILEGVFSIEWATAQQQHLSSLGRLTTGHTWLVRLIRRLWEIAWNTWSHRNSVATTSNNKRKHEQLSQQLLSELETANDLRSSLHIPSDLSDAIPHMSLDSKSAWIDHIRAHKKIKLFQPIYHAEIRQMQRTMSQFLTR